MMRLPLPARAAVPMVVLARAVAPVVMLARVAVPVVMLALVGPVALVAPPARAQTFDNIFNNLFNPPRPPADVPNVRRAPPPFFPQRELPPPRSDAPPEEPLPAPMALPPRERPNRGIIQSEELAPPPGAEPTDRAIAPVPGAPGSQPPGTPQQQQQPAALDSPQDQVVVAPPPQRIKNPHAVFAGLDKITGRIISFDVALDETVQFGALQVTPKACYSRPPTETPQTDAFVEVDEVTLQGEIKRIFTGWMFAASPGLHAVEHPIYDVWLTNCKGGAGEQPAVSAAAGAGQITGDSAPVANPPTPPRRPSAPPPQGAQPRGFQPILRQ
jgi:hypothetical protein